MTNSSAVKSPWFQGLSRSDSPALRLFCFPFAGGNAQMYRSWQRWLPHNLEIQLVHLPGRGIRIGEPPLRRLSALVAELADHMDRGSTVPYAFYGHSMGALTSFELARELSRRGKPGPEHLFVSGRRAPHIPATKAPIFDRSDEEFILELKTLNGTPQDVLDNPELMEIFIDVLRADFEAVDTYEYLPEPPLSCPITVYGGLEDEDVPMESCYAWQKHTALHCKVRMLAGDHFFVRNPTSEFTSAFSSDLLTAIPKLRPR